MLQKDQVAEQGNVCYYAHPTPPHDMLQKAVSAKNQTQEVK